MSGATELEKAKAREQLVDSIRDLYSAKITLPLGNPNLKLVHTNQFLFTELPTGVFELANFDAIAKALNSTYSRFSGYTINRWYIEAVTITNDGNTAKMELDLNPFASNVIKFRDEKNSFREAYTNTTKSTSSNTTNKTSSSKTKIKSVKTANSTLKGGEGKLIDNLVKKIVGSETNELKKAKLVHGWLQKNVRYSYYTCTRYNTPEKCYNNRGHLNCADTARLTRAMMASAGLKCYIVHRTYNGGHFWTVIEIAGKKYASDQTGSGSAWNTVWKSSGRTGNGGYAPYSRKNGKVPDC